MSCNQRYAFSRKSFRSVVRHAAEVLVICACVLLSSQWARAAAHAPDQCAGALPVGSATGCGVIITVTAVDGNGNATAATITVPGNGNPYDGDDDTLVGVQNNSGGVLLAVTLTSSSTTFGGIFGFDGDGACNYATRFSENSNDCFNGPFPEPDPLDYEGPSNTFSNINSVSCPIFETCYTSGTVNFTGNGIAPGGSTWFALEGTPQAIATITQTGQTMNPNNPANLSQQFTFNNTTGEHVEFDFNYLTAFGIEGDLTVVQDTVPTVADQGITQATYAQLVAGTSLATTQCFISPGEGTDSNGNSLCAQFTLECTNANSSTPAGDNCPQSTQRNLLFNHVLDINPALTTVPAGSAPTLAEGSDTWSPGNCTLVGPEAGNLCPESLLTQFFTTGSDPKPGGTTKTSNSTFIAGCCEPEWTTVPTVPQWFNNTTVPVSFTSSPPAAPPTPNNNWVASPNQAITWGWENLGQTPDPTFPIPGDQTVTNPTACPSTWPAPGTTPPNATASGTVTVPGEGAFEVHFFSTACDAQEELLFTPQTSQTTNWAAFKTAPFNVDTTSPMVSSITLNASGGYYAQNSSATATVVCTDPSSPTVPNFFSGIAQCGQKGSPQLFTGNQQTVTTTPIPLSTATLGTQTFTAIAQDVAGNLSAPSSVSYTVVGSADLAVGMIGNILVKSGTNLTYLIGIANNGPNTADLVTLTDTLPAGTTFVSSGYAIESCTLSGGRPNCNISPPTNSCGSVPGSCSIGALPAWTKKNPIGVLVQITVNVNASPGATIKNSATTGEVNSDPNSNNNTAIWYTIVTH